MRYTDDYLNVIDSLLNVFRTTGVNSNLSRLAVEEYERLNHIVTAFSKSPFIGRGVQFNNNGKYYPAIIKSVHPCSDVDLIVFAEDATPTLERRVTYCKTSIGWSQSWRFCEDAIGDQSDVAESSAAFKLV